MTILIFIIFILIVLKLKRFLMYGEYGLKSTDELFFVLDYFILFSKFNVVWPHANMFLIFILYFVHFLSC
jgi:hypothetical protein